MERPDSSSTPTPVGRIVAQKQAANQGALDEALRAEYQTGLDWRLADEDRLTATWGARYLGLTRRVKLASVVQTAMDLLQCDHGALTMIGKKAETIALIGLNAPTIHDVSDTYCQHVSDGTPFQVNDAEGNSLACTLMGTIEHGVRSYLGVPIVFADMVVGSLCVFDMIVRDWTPGEVRLLGALARTVEHVLDSESD